MVELTVNGEKAQMDIAKAREVCQMLHQAIEAAITDTLIYQFMVERIGMDAARASQVLLDFRELRQGSKSVVYPQ
jgi:aerobic-type carbon monoxide dehydrogenase small subunit (CoxS/CutS family)